MRTIKLFVLAALLTALTVIVGGVAAQDALRRSGGACHPRVAGLDVYVNGI